MLTATYLYAGMGDYWGGDSDRWDDNAGCLFSSYGRTTTLRDIIDGWVEDFWQGGDCESMPLDISEDDVREALLKMLTPAGRADYANNSIAECAADFAACNDEEEEHDMMEYPVCIVLLKWDA